MACAGCPSFQSITIFFFKASADHRDLHSFPTRRSSDLKVIEARSGEAALDLIRNAAETINLLITDVVMPHMDGPGLVREVRELNPEMKVIFISGYTEEIGRAHV